MFDKDLSIDDIISLFNNKYNHLSDCSTGDINTIFSLSDNELLYKIEKALSIIKIGEIGSSIFSNLLNLLKLDESIFFNSNSIESTIMRMYVIQKGLKKSIKSSSNIFTFDSSLNIRKVEENECVGMLEEFYSLDAATIATTYFKVIYNEYNLYLQRPNEVLIIDINYNENDNKNELLLDLKIINV